MKILFIAPANSIHTFRWLQYFSNQGHDVYLLTDEIPEYNFSPATVITLPKKPFILNLFYYIRQVSDIVKKINPDISHVHYLTYLRWVPGLINSPNLLITPWGSDLFQSSSKWASYMNRVSFSRAKYTLADSYLLLDIAEKFGATKTRLITFGVDSQLFQPVSVEVKSVYRKKYKVPEDAFVIFSGRAMTSLYNIDLILESFIQVVKARPQSFLILLDYNSELKYKMDLVKTIEENQLGHRVLLQPGVPYAQLSELYNLSDIMLSVPSTDGTPASFFESMACKIPVLSFKHMAYENIFKEQEHLFYIHSLNVNELSEKIVFLMENTVLRKSVLETALKLSQEHAFSLQMGKVHDIYTDMLMSK